VPFAACYLGNRLVLLGLYLRAWWHVREARPTIVVYLIIVGFSAALWAGRQPRFAPLGGLPWPLRLGRSPSAQGRRRYECRRTPAGGATALWTPAC